VEAAYDQYISLLDTPDKLWFASEAIQDLIDRLYHKVGGDALPAMPPETIATLEARLGQLNKAVTVARHAEEGLSLSQQRFFSVDVRLGLEVAQLQTQAALLLEEALRTPDTPRMWQFVLEARTPLELLEVDFLRAEYPPFDRWYQTSWIRSAVSFNNPHRPYVQLRAFISSEGHGQIARGPAR
jgi:hypothetical protein